MASKALLFLFAAFLLVNGTVAGKSNKKGSGSGFGVTVTIGGGGGKSPSKPAPSKSPPPPTPTTPTTPTTPITPATPATPVAPGNDDAENELAGGATNPTNPSHPLRNMLSNSNIQLATYSDAPGPASHHHELDCLWLCKDRCKDHSHSERGQCLSACQLCCDRCKCVPPGTSGNKEKCGRCYDEQSVIYGYKITCP